MEDTWKVLKPSLVKYLERTIPKIKATNVPPKRKGIILVKISLTKVLIVSLDE